MGPLNSRGRNVIFTVFTSSLQVLYPFSCCVKNDPLSSTHHLHPLHLHLRLSILRIHVLNAAACDTTVWILRDLKAEGHCGADGNPGQFQAALASCFSTSALRGWLVVLHRRRERCAAVGAQRNGCILISKYINVYPRTQRIVSFLGVSWHSALVAGSPGSSDDTEMFTCRSRLTWHARSLLTGRAPACVFV